MRYLLIVPVLLLTLFLPSRFTQAAERSERKQPGALQVDVRSRPDRPWKPQPTTTLQQLANVPAADSIKLDRFGGRADRAEKATGFFRTQRIEGRWWLIDPEGHPFYSVGLCTVAADPPDARAQVEKRFGSVAHWAELTLPLLRNNGFNTLGCWSWWEDFRKLPEPIPYTTQWRFLTAFEEKLGGKPFERKDRSNPRSLIYVFEPGFESFCDQHARQLAATKDDPYLLGHFSDNELAFQVDLLDEFLKLPPDHSGHKAAKAWLEKRKNSSSTNSGSTSKADGEAFRGYVAETYYRTVGRAIKKYDPNHLYIGSRLHGRNLNHEELFRACAPYADVVSINYYHRWTPDRKEMDRWLAWSGRPFVITEWYAKGDDSGLSNQAGAGWTVKTQEDRGRFYQNFALGLLKHPGCVGWHWFRYQDNGPQREGGTSNKGLVNLEYKVYETLRGAMSELNHRVYALLDTRLTRTASHGP